MARRCEDRRLARFYRVFRLVIVVRLYTPNLGHAFIQNLRGHHYGLGTHARPGLHVAAALDELTPAL